MEETVFDKIKTAITSKLYINAGLEGEPISRIFFSWPTYPLENCGSAD